VSQSVLVLVRLPEEPRRAHDSGVEPPAARLQFGPLTLIPDERVLLRDGKALSLTPKAFDLLAFLAANPGRLLTKDELLHAIWPDAVVEESNLAYTVFAIRKALGESAESARYIETVPKRGYRFVAPVVRDEPNADRAGPTSTEPAVSMLRFQEQWWGRPSEPPSFSISPDGRHLVLGAEGPDGVPRLWVRTLSEPSPRAVPGTESALVVPPFWSPDSSFLASASGGPLKKISLSGGTPQTICEIKPNAVGGSWNRDDVILVGNPSGGLIRCSASGGRATLATRTAEPSEMHIFPSFLPDGRRFIYLRVYRQAPERSGLYVGDLTSESSDGDMFLMATGFNGSYVSAADTGPGVLLFLRDRSLYAQRFDDDTVELRGTAVKVADRLGSYLDYAYYSASEKLLAYRVPDPPSQLTWFDREGRPVAPVGAPEAVAGLAVSPDGSFALVARHVPHNVVTQDLWLFDLRRDTNPRRVTFAPTLAAFPVWVTSERFLFTLGGPDGSVYEQTIGGQRRLLFSRNGGWPMPTSTTAGGRVVVFTTVADPAMGADIWIWTNKGAPLITREGDQTQAQLSADGRWLAYVSNETGRNEVFVAAFRFDESTGDATVGDSLSVSAGGGFAPRWRGDGKELFYLKVDGSVMAIEADGAPAFSSGPARRLFIVPGVFPEWGVTNDGSRFLFAVPTAPPPPLDIIYDWQSALPK
jgi:eukaryotic-like serine/threonine-protein kinase